MNIYEIFQLCHSSINIENQIKKISDEKIITFLKKIELNPEMFFKINNFIYPYCYFNKENSVYIEIPEFSNDIFEMLSIKERITTMNETVNKLLLEKKYLDVFCFMEKKIRFIFLEKWSSAIPNDQFLKVFQFVYSSSEGCNESININILNRIKNLSSDTLDKFDNIMEIYRGETVNSKPVEKAYSWTLDKKTAEFFANRFNQHGNVLKACVNKKDVLTYIDDRGEEEILIMPNSAYNVKKIG